MHTLLYVRTYVCATVDRLRDELHQERLEKESMEESSRQLKQTTSQLQQRVKELTLDQSQSMSVEDHRAALNEMQQWVAVGCAGCARTHWMRWPGLPAHVHLWPYPFRLVQSFKADAESSSEKLTKEVRSLRRDKKALMSKLAGEGGTH